MTFTLSDLRYVDQELRWHRTEAPWSAEDAKLYRTTDRNACDFRTKTKRAASSLRFLTDLDPLLGLTLQGGFREDAVVFGLTHLRCLILMNRAEGQLDLGTLPDLEVLALDNRPGLEQISNCPSLKSFVVWSWRGTDMAAMRAAPALEHLKLEGKGQDFSFDGLQGAQSLRACQLFDVCPIDLSALAPLTQLQFLRVVAPRIGSKHQLDLSPLASLTSLVWLTLDYCGSIPSLAPLRQLPSLAGVSIVGTDVRDGDLRPLLDLPPGATATFDNRPHYSHTSDMVDRIRSSTTT